MISVQAQEESEIPSWIKIIAGAWFNDEIDDATFADAMEFLIENNIIQVENPINMAEPEESEIIINLNEQIEKLRIENDAIEESKDVLEEEFMKKESETQAYYEQKIEDMRLQLSENNDDKIKEILKETDAENEKQKESYRELSTKWDSLWNEYRRLYGNISEVRENTNPSDFE